MRKLKKLTLKKEVISDLGENEMNQLKGGDTIIGPSCLNCYTYTGQNTCPQWVWCADSPKTPAPTPLGTQPGGGQVGCQNYTVGCPSVGCTTMAWQGC